MKHLLLLGLCSTLAIGQASAVTVDDVNGRYAALQFIGNTALQGLPEGSNTVYLVKTGTNTMRMEHFMGYYDINVTLNADGTLTMPLKQTLTSADGTRTLKIYKAPYINYSWKHNNANGWSIVKPTGDNSQWYGYDRSTDASLQTTAYQKLPHSIFYGWQFGDFNTHLAFEETYDGTTHYDVVREMQLHVMFMNSTATDSNNATYRVGIALNKDDMFLANLMGAGIFHESYKNGSVWDTEWKYNLDAVIDNNTNTFTIPSQIVGGSSTATNKGFTSVTLKRGYGSSLAQISYNAYVYTSANFQSYNKYICSSGGKNGTIFSGQPVTGSFTCGQPWHETEQEASAWSSLDNIPGGYTHTYADVSLHLNHMKRFNMETSAWMNDVDYTDILPDNDRLDITHQCYIDLSNCGIGTSDGRTVMFVKGKVESLMNNRFVDHYELWLMPGEATTYDDTDFFDTTKGHVNGICLDNDTFNTDYEAEADHYASADVSNLPLYDADGTFRRLIYTSDLGAADVVANPEYSLYVKTYYTPESQLTPTFHAARKLVQDQITSLPQDALSNNQQPVININGCELMVSGANGAVDVVTTDGRLLYHGGDVTMTLPRGIYIVRTSSSARTILAK